MLLFKKYSEFDRTFSSLASKATKISNLGYAISKILDTQERKK